jgi:diguanylate cyclase (GGDEF)-like protein
MIIDDGVMPDIVRRSPADLKPLAPGLSAEVQDWADALRMSWAATGLSMNQFASLHPIDKGTISRYLNGQRVPRDRWFLDKLLALKADYGQPVTPAVREHLAELQLRALAVAHPHEYRVRRVSDELQIALTAKLEAERYARALEEQLTDRNRQVSELAEVKGRLRAAWDADRVAMQADCERLAREIGQIAGQLHLARERTAQAERRCQILEDLLDHLDAHTPAGDEDRIDTKTGLLNASTWEQEAEAEINRAVRSGTPLALALVGIDNASLADGYGREGLLRTVISMLQFRLRAHDLACRFGEQEFAILLPHVREVDAISVAEEIRHYVASIGISATGNPAWGPYGILMASAGVATLDDESGTPLIDMLADATAALCQARETGGNKTHLTAAPPDHPERPPETHDRGLVSGCG